MTPVDALPCRDFVELATGYQEGTLPLPARARVERHLAVCPPCQTYLAQLQQTVRWLGRLPATAPPPSARRALRGLFRAWQRGAR